MVFQQSILIPMSIGVIALSPTKIVVHLGFHVGDAVLVMSKRRRMGFIQTQNRLWNDERNREQNFEKRGFYMLR
jgi:hypothetical protein